MQVRTLSVFMHGYTLFMQSAHVYALFARLDEPCLCSASGETLPSTWPRAELAVSFSRVYAGGQRCAPGSTIYDAGLKTGGGGVLLAATGPPRGRVVAIPLNRIAA